MNAYHFYRTHQQEMKFLDQYESLPCCGASSDVLEALTRQDQNFAMLANLFRPRSARGPLKDLPLEALWELSVGVAARLAKRSMPLETDVLEEIAASCWKAVS